MYNEGKPLGVDKLATARAGGEYDQQVKMTQDMVNLLLEVTHDLVHMARPMTAGIAMTSFAVTAGIVQGQMEVDGMVPEITDEALIKLLVDNFQTGRKIAFQNAAHEMGGKN